MSFTAAIIAQMPTERPSPDMPTPHTFYFTGKACKHGHVAPRYVSTGNCTQCHRRTITKRRLPGATYITFPALSTAIQRDPTLGDKVGIILFNDAQLMDWLIERARAGEQGLGATKVRFEAGPAPLSITALVRTGKLANEGLTLADMVGNGWTPEQLVEHGYAALAKT